MEKQSAAQQIPSKDVGQVPAKTVIGTPSVQIWNCTSDPVSIGIWQYEKGNWTRRGTIDPQWDPNSKLCGPTVSSAGMVVNAALGEIFRLIATDLTVGDDPAKNSDIKDWIDVEGGNTAPSFPWTVS